MFEKSCIVNEGVEAGIESLCDLAPVHNAGHLKGIRAVDHLMPTVPQVTVFDNAFHATMPPEAYLYAIPYELYEKYHSNPYNHKEISEKVANLMSDDCVRDKKGVFEYVLGGCTDTRLLNIRFFEINTIRKVYKTQTDRAKKKETSNCPLCAIGHEANKKRIWKLEEMDADHVEAWSKGGETTEKNCQMLCKTHNRAKGNR